MPLYWIATFLQIATKLYWHRPTPHGIQQLLLSLAFIPDFASGSPDLQPIHNVGWTLNYEMAFYLLFTLCLLLPLKRGVAVILAITTLLPVLHPTSVVAAGHPLLQLWAFYTDPILRFFAFGVFMGYVELKLKQFDRFSVAISPAFLMIAAAMILLSFPAIAANHSIWWVSGCFGAIVAVLCTVVMLNRPGRFNRFLVLLGDASYSTYLFHFWSNVLIILFVLRVYAHFHQTISSPFLALGVAAIGANLTGLIIHILLERPITRALRSLNPGRFVGGREGLKPLQ